MTLDVVILAAGQGTRMRSRRPKVLHELAGRPMVRHVLDTAGELDTRRLHVVIGHGGDQVREALGDTPADFVVQAEQKGTGHAVAQALDALGDGKVLILYGDVPLIRRETLAALLDRVDERRMALLTVTLENPAGYGRIKRDERGHAVAIVEHKDATPAERRVQECNTGIMAMTAAQLRRWLPRLSADNAQGEYYLTDVIAMAAGEGIEIATAQPGDPVEVEGVNDRVQLARLERIVQRDAAERLMRSGATLADPGRLEVRGRVDCGRDVFIDVGCVFEGNVELADGVHVGPYCVIRDARLGPDSTIQAHSVIEGATLDGGSQVGPFARLRPGTHLARGARIGNFVETKNAEVGEGAKINHLSYVGDARLGRDVNIGAGTITCNYDGANKHHTEIGDRAFIGSNTALVAPVSVGEGATVGAGSTISKDVEAGSLAVARSRQTSLGGWQRPTKRSS
ncbi:MULTISPECIES: bifunctional UDP-N-acetylglucosamine diphosphorylase/glucosamine-1-phosphate N-acetyltransferase GlmU [unclassified Modicisalibacter]|uniref:bifunctional UDP-N-acetylglucosamine diphosphorylase/glucosamine-1-phosphate N-acetyltransferase GlmU n=1 Tax=unclassified Modicisalibacter TaxID=2679913 RepID=UPI001CCA1821|nr:MULTISPECIES: bifunctional UDP-N-acetylglucosamine diphosphorylase/glucosamine-1-phosphate N-acetyltransferase GlmU [unclassified Modicisalibacter]MBZ9558653.1 bifunctional UDP-N-acetylglucosamine diphosphorylase/glucosamine-1-phosphate N-acetyltransferase GlmU [Modicisalibacter sp. R2A 31.J]MBZ9575455.1 bifunctional UDP-N-acetylglucosamine diphosphorylase/glucosamine-1-phosphate N-acetyltransferase GlmU [Modicisalibacter sp. MOD 31.J]